MIRCRLTEAAGKAFRLPRNSRRVGTVIKWGGGESNYLQILWDGRKTVEPWHINNIEILTDDKRS